MVRGYGLDRIQVYARIVHQSTSERMKPSDVSLNEELIVLRGHLPFDAIVENAGWRRWLSERADDPDWT
jgi:hypothetical protein